MTITRTVAGLLATLSLAWTAGPAPAHGDGKHPKPSAPARKEQQPWGIAGDARDVKRTIRIAMTDAMRFEPSRIDVKQGETVRFVVQNKGQAMHEMVIGTKAALDEHAALMTKFPDMEHDEPHMAHVAAGRKEDLVWTFNRAGDFEFACLVAGHYQAGMVGRIKVAAAGGAR